MANGDAEENSASESQHAVADASGGSDTDISRPGSVDQSQRSDNHLRTNSVKKPTSFKSVSALTKNFLAKSVVSAPAVRSGEKAATSAQAATSAVPTAKPRLVAKSGGGNVPRSIGKMNGAGTGPDASKVWNKNQPVPIPPPKQFTDEELKQQYGIHLATRLVDDGGKEAKWADIDEDEDDWTPPTVQWMDGTKSTVAAVENEPPPPEEPKTVLKKETPPVAAKPTPPATPTPQKTTLNSSTKTILKPGAHVLSSASKSKGQPERPTLVAKPSTGAPVKSPWAPLPPVEKAPVQINPPVQPTSSRYRRDSQGYDSMPPPPAPAKEIAPDDFNRAWRDERGNRELFNSHSGRYEPVREVRRGSVRDNNFRQQPSVLQRPAHDGPAEPSAAFQTSRTSGDAPTWGRRRNSSNVSGDSGRLVVFDNRASENPPMQMNTPRRESQSINGVDTGAPGTSRHALPPRPVHNDVIPSPMAQAPKPSPSISQAQPASPFGSAASQDNPTPTAAPPIQNLVEVQQRVMHDNIDTIKQRKQKEREREAKEALERKERLRLKMEALGFNEPKKAKEANQVSPSQGPQKSPLKEQAAPAPIQSPPKPPVPTAEGEIAQYGMIKVHQPHPVKKPEVPASRPLASSPAPVKSESKPQPNPSPSLGQAQPPNTHVRDSIVKLPASQPNSTVPQPIPTGPQGSKPNQSSQAPGPWSTSLPPQARPWTSSVWGPPQTKDRALGNGTFVQQVGTQSQSGQAPIGTNPAMKSTPSHQQAASKQPFAQNTMYSKAGAALPTAATNPRPIPPPVANGWGDFHAHILRDDRNKVLKSQQELEKLGGQPIRHEMRETYIDQQGKTQTRVHAQIGGIDAKATAHTAGPDSKTKNEVPRIGVDDNWNESHSQILRDDRDRILKSQQALERLGGIPIKHEMRETFIDRKGKSHTVVHAQIGGIQASSVPTTVAPDLKPEEVARVGTDGPSPSHGLGQSPHSQPSAQGARSSRFFPRPSETVPQASSPSPEFSPPPPETQSHPVFTGESEHPVVKMPKPSPRVKLPPAVVETPEPEAAVTMPPRSRLGPGMGSRPLALTAEWQARFNNLLDKPAAPSTGSTSGAKPPASAHIALPKPGSLAIAASSKAPLDVIETSASATVSFPHTTNRKTFANDGSSEVTTRISADFLLEDREFGSLPTVNLNRVPHLAADEPPADFPPTGRQNSRYRLPNVELVSKPSFDVEQLEEQSDNINVRVKIGAMQEAVMKSMPRKRKTGRMSGQTKPRKNYSNGPNDRSSTNGQNQRSRNTSRFQNQNQNQNQTNSSHSTPRAPAGNVWSNNRSTTTHTWARRAAAPTAPVH
jgi:hypothetical protein